MIDNADFTVTACLMDHGTPSAAYCVREKPRSNIDTAVLARMGLGPGAWLKRIKDQVASPQEEVQIGGKPSYSLRLGRTAPERLRPSAQIL